MDSSEFTKIGEVELGSEFSGAMRGLVSLIKGPLKSRCVEGKKKAPQRGAFLISMLKSNY